MSRTIVVSDDAYMTLLELAARQGRSPEDMLETLIQGALPDYVPGGTDELLKRMGMSDAEIAAANADPSSQDEE